MKHTESETMEDSLQMENTLVPRLAFKEEDHSNKGHILAEFYGPDRLANKERTKLIWNASNGMTTEEAVRYLEHGKEMESVLRDTLQILFRDTACPDAHGKIWQLLATMEGK